MKDEQPKLTVAQQFYEDHLKDATPQELAIWRKLALDNFEWFCMFVLGYLITPFHAQMINHRTKGRYNMVLAPRGSGKSTILDVAYLLWRVIKNPNLRCCIASKSGPQAQSFLGEIKQHIESNPNVLKLFGDLKGTKWNTDEIILKTRTKILKEPTIVAKSVGAGTPGFHFDIIIADDLVDMENSATELQREKMFNWFFRVLKPTLEPDTGEFYIIGTRYHPSDLYGFFAGHKKDHQGVDIPDQYNNDMFGPNVLTVPALQVDNNGNEFSFWPIKFEIETLWALRKESLLNFNLGYQNDASVVEGGIINLEDLECATYTKETLPPLSEMVIFQGVDPAISEKQTADFFAHCTIGVHNHKDIYILEITKQRIPFGKQIEYILAKQDQWGAVKVGIETIAYQKALVQAIKERSSWFPVFEVRPRIDKTMRAKIFSAFTQRKEVHFHHSHYEAMQTLAGMPNPSSKHDDLFDAVDIAVEAAKEFVLTNSIVVRLPSNLRKR